MPTFVYCGTEDAAVVSLEMSVGGLCEQKQRLELPNPLWLSRGSPGGIAVEWVVAHPARKHVYALVSSWDHAPGELFSLDIDAEGELTIGTSVPSGGYQPCHAVLCGTDYMLIAHYLSAEVAVFNISLARGYASKPVLLAKTALPRRGAALEPLLPSPPPGWVMKTPLRLLMRDASKFRAPEPGEFAPLCHGLALAPDDDYLVACDAGQGVIVTYGFDRQAGKLGAHTSYPLPEPPGTGSLGSSIVAARLGHRPRHACFSPDGTFLYVLHEAANVVTILSFDGNTGLIISPIGHVPSYPGLTPAPTVPCAAALPGALGVCLGGVYAAAEILIHPSSGGVFTTTRGFGLGASGCLRGYRPEALLQGMGRAGLKATLDVDVGSANVRHCTFDPSGKWLLVGSMATVTAYQVTPHGDLREQDPRTSEVDSRDMVNCMACVVVGEFRSGGAAGSWPAVQPASGLLTPGRTPGRRLPPMLST